MNNMVKVELLDGYEGYNKVKETLTRLGIPSKKNKELFQSCHILKRTVAGQTLYYIAHFKELFELEGKETIISPKDILRRNYIVHLLSEWKLIKSGVVEQQHLPVNKRVRPYILSYEESKEWKLTSKYTINSTLIKSIDDNE